MTHEEFQLPQEITQVKDNLQEALTQTPAPRIERTLWALAIANSALRFLSDSFRWDSEGKAPEVPVAHLARQALKEAQRLQGLSAHMVSSLQKAVNNVK